MIPRSTIEEVKSRIDLGDFIASYGIDLRPAGADDFKACCPFHQEKTPSFHVHPQRGYYHCFGCGESGNVFSFAMKHNGWGFMDALKHLAEKAGVKLEEREDPNARLRQRLLALHAEAAAFFRRCLLQTAEAAPAREYLADRKLSEETGEAFTIGYAPVSPEAMLKWAEKHGFTGQEMAASGILLPPKYPGGRWYNRFGGRVMFAIADKTGRVVAFSGRTLSSDKKIAKYVNSPETAIFKKSAVLFAFDKAARAISKHPRREAIVCEGQIDVIRCHACGFDRAVASQGTSFTEEHANLLSRTADSVMLLFDADEAGLHAAVRTAGLFLAKGMPVKVASLPQGEDPDSFLRSHTPAEFQSVLDAAESIAAFQVRTMLEGGADTVFAAREAMATIRLCSSAVMKETLSNEAAKLLGIAPSAFASDMARTDEQRTGGKPPAPPGRGAEMRGGGSSPSREKQGEAASSRLNQGATASSRSNGDELIDEEEARYLALEASLRAADAFDAPPAAEDPRLAVPDARDMEFCNFLFSHEHDSALATLADAAPPEIFANPFTRSFVAAWKDSLSSEADAFAALRETLDATAQGWFDRIAFAPDKTAVSELQPADVMRDFLRKYWCNAIRDKRMRLAPGSPENQMLSLTLTSLAKTFRQRPWDALTPLFAQTLETLARPE